MRVFGERVGGGSGARSALRQQATADSGALPTGTLPWFWRCNKGLVSGAAAMSWRGTTVMGILMLGNWAATNVALAQTFEERWSPIPKAHAEPSAAPQPNPQIEPNPQPAPNAQVGSEPQVKQTQRPKRSKTASKRSSHGRAAGRHVFTGTASYYAYHAGTTASGQPFNPYSLTAAHRSLPFGTRVRVTDVKTKKSVEVVITDRGPVSRKRVLDLSLGAARALDIGDRGIIQVRAEIISG